VGTGTGGKLLGRCGPIPAGHCRPVLPYLVTQQIPVEPLTFSEKNHKPSAKFIVEPSGQLFRGAGLLPVR
jgi:hypothetical protein